MLMAPNNLHITNGILTAAAGGTTTAAIAAAAAATAGDAATERSTASGRQNAEQPLRCPRCDSSNTKFCYYNNYSLSQPRHFCKACKRHWTRGGTLRNVPVGGGCRKNKRTRKSRTSSPSAAPSTGNAAATSADPSPVPRLSSHPKPTPIATTASSSGLGQSFYGPSSDVIQWPFLNPCISYDLQSQFSTLGLFPSNADEDYLRGLKTDLADHRNIPQPAPAAAPTPSLNSLLHDYSLLGPNPLASLHASSLKQQHDQRIARNTKLSLYAALLADAAGGGSALFNGVTVEGSFEGMPGGGSDNRFDWQIPSCENAMEHVAGESPMNWNAATAPAFGGGALL